VNSVEWVSENNGLVSCPEVGAPAPPHKGVPHWPEATVTGGIAAVAIAAGILMIAVLWFSSRRQREQQAIILEATPFTALPERRPFQQTDPGWTSDRETPGFAEVGAVLVCQRKVICTGFNEGEMRHDPTAHGEMVVIRRACEQLKRPAWKEPLYIARCSRSVCVRWRACGRASAESSLARAAGTYMRCISNRGITTPWTSSGTPSAVTWRSKEV
jgi:hypothetical protein